MSTVPKSPLIISDSVFTTSRINQLYSTNNIQGPYTCWKNPVRVATVANITLQGLQTIDGVTLVNNDRILVKNQTDAIQNGIYISRTGPWMRSIDLPNGSNASALCCYIKEGTVNGNYIYYVVSTDLTLVVGVDEINFYLLNNSDISTDGVLDSILIKSETGFIGYESLKYTEDTECHMTIGTSLTDSIIQTNSTTDTNSITLNIVANKASDLTFTTGEGTNSGNITFKTGDPDNITRYGSGGDILITTGTTKTDGSQQDSSITISTSNGHKAGDISFITDTSSETYQSNIIITNNSYTTSIGTTSADVNTTYTEFNAGGLGIKFLNNRVQFPVSTVVMATLAVSPTINTKQGFISVTDPSSLGAGNSASITVNNTMVDTDSIIKVSVNTYTGNGIPVVQVITRTNATSFVIKVTNRGTVSLSATTLIIGFIIL